LALSAKVGEILRKQEESGRFVGAICAAPIALQAHRVFRNRQLTSHPSVKEMLEDWGEYSENPVVADGNLITSRGPGTAFPFALRIVGTLTDAQRMLEVRAPMMFPVQVS
jgi:protein DJ-1